MKRILIPVLLASLVPLSVALAPATVARRSAEVTTCTGHKLPVSRAEKAILQLHNEARREHGLARLCVRTNLVESARFHSREEIRNDYYSHCSKNAQGKCYEQWDQRVRRFGYSGNYCCPENLHIGWDEYASPKRIFRDWRNSSGHWVNIIDPRIREIGVGTFTGSWKGQRNTTTFTVDFGAR